jgi:glycosyltransferase involved in cell wall biosynthesis
MAKICLMTPGQPSTNPRLVKEADTLVEAGHQVHVLCPHMVAWADEADKKLLAKREWTCSYVGGNRGSLRYGGTRLRHALVRKFSANWSAGSWLGDRALTRVTPELLAAAEKDKAELYIAHYVGALAAAVQAARKNGALVAFDAEDFESGYFTIQSGPEKIDRLIEDVERKYLPGCCYVTAASPSIAAAYRTKYRIPLPTGILNVFPISERPKQFRETAPSDPVRLYWFSQTIGPGRGLEDVVRAMGRLQHYKIQLHLRGIARTDYWQHLQNLARTNSVDPQAIIVRSPLPPEEMICAASEFDVGLALEQPLSFNRDVCLTNKIFSYLLAGNAIAASHTCGQRPIMEQIGRAGFLYHSGDVDALADGIGQWCENRKELDQARRKAWFWGSRSFNWEQEKSKFLMVVNNVLTAQEFVENAS